MKRNLEHITCKNACTFCDHDNIVIICKPAKRICHRVIAEGLCVEGNKQSDDNSESEVN